MASITRLGLYGGPRAPYGTFTGKVAPSVPAVVAGRRGVAPQILVPITVSIASRVTSRWSLWHTRTGAVILVQETPIESLRSLVAVSQRVPSFQSQIGPIALYGSRLESHSQLALLTCLNAVLASNGRHRILQLSPSLDIQLAEFEAVQQALEHRLAEFEAVQQALEHRRKVQEFDHILGI